VPVLLVCRWRSEKEKLGCIVREAGIIASFQWPKESLEFVKTVRKKVELTGYEKILH
jgi:hypothetical protein